MRTQCLGVLPTQKTWLRILFGQKESPHTHKPGKAGVLEHKGLCLTKNLIPGRKKSMQTQIPTQSWELWSEQEVNKIWISSWLWIISWFLSKSGGLYQGALVKEIRSCCQRLDKWYEEDEAIPPLHIPWPIGYLWSQSKEKAEECVYALLYVWMGKWFLRFLISFTTFWLPNSEDLSRKGRIERRETTQPPIP
jgi:hypothetical protein